MKSEIASRTIHPSSVAAVIPVFNESGDGLVRTLEGLLLQKRSPDHLLVVDDGSESPATIPARLGSAVDVVRLSENVGIAAARNRGAGVSGTEYLLFVNCNVVLTPDWLERAMALMESRLDVGAVSGRIIPLKGPKILRDWRLHCLEPKVHRAPPANPTPVSWLVGHVLLVRRSAFDKIGGFDSRFRSAGEDWDFSQRLLAGGYAILHIPTLVAECHELVSVEGLARKVVRNAGWNLHLRSGENSCAATRPLRPVPATLSIIRICGEQIGRHLLKHRFRFVAVDLTITIRGVILIWRARRVLSEPKSCAGNTVGD